MSGGFFDYDQYRINGIIDAVEGVLDKHEHPGADDDGWNPLAGSTPETVEAFQQGLHTLRQAAIYAQRFDWFLSGDDGEEAFLRRLKNDLDLLEKK